MLYAPRGPRAIYPDIWTGPAAYESDIYPDIWNGPAAYVDYLYPDRYRPVMSRRDKHRVRRKVSISSPSSTLALIPRELNTMNTHAFNEEAFHARIKALRDRGETEGPPERSDSENFDYGPKFSGANDIPLGKIRRTHSSVTEPHDTRSTSKQLRLEAPSSSQTSGQAILIDLTSDDDTPTDPVRQTTPRQALQVTTNRASPSDREFSRTPPPKDSQTLVIRPANVPTPTFPPSDTKLEKPHTVRIFTKAATKLRQSQEFIQSDKRALSRCWETDPTMQTAEMMERLRALNEYYRVVEDGLEAALGIVEELI